MDRLEELDKLNKSNALYWSAPLEEHLATLWEMGIDKVRYSKYTDKAANEEIKAKVAGLHRQMKDDLAVDKMASLMRERNKQ